ncbi:hypothetical protein GW17_00031642 [Ensete ventricosum]|nr:hypothetical protein GW17_00031642 [Ensete ventricosum]
MEAGGGGGGGEGRVWDCGSPLYDSFELASFSHVLDRHTMVLPTELQGMRMTMVVWRENNESKKKKTTKKAKKMIRRGLRAIYSRIAFWRKP